MELIATSRPAVAYALGAYLTADGTRLRCGLLFVDAANKRKKVTLRDPDSKFRVRVRLPKAAVGNPKRTRFSRETLEVV